MSVVVFIDIDGVLIKKQTQELFLNYLLSSNKIRLWRALSIYLWFFLYRIGFCKNVIEVRKFAFKVFCNWDKEIMGTIIHSFYDNVLSSNLNLTLIKRIKEHQFRNDTVILLSATLEEIANCLARILNIKYVIATKLEIKEGKYTGNICGEVPYGMNKVKLAENFIKMNNLTPYKTLAYCDHFSDLSLLNYVSKAIVVNPDNRLEEFALLNNWEILNY